MYNPLRLFSLALLVPLSLVFCMGATEGSQTPSSEPPECYVKRESWQSTMLASRSALMSLTNDSQETNQIARQLWIQIEKDFPVQWDWMLQDGGYEEIQREPDKLTP